MKPETQTGIRYPLILWIERCLLGDGFAGPDTFVELQLLQLLRSAGTARSPSPVPQLTRKQTTSEVIASGETERIKGKRIQRVGCGPLSDAPRKTLPTLVAIEHLDYQ